MNRASGLLWQDTMNNVMQGAQIISRNNLMAEELKRRDQQLKVENGFKMLDTGITLASKMKDPQSRRYYMETMTFPAMKMLKDSGIGVDFDEQKVRDSWSKLDDKSLSDTIKSMNNIVTDVKGGLDYNQGIAQLNTTVGKAIESGLSSDEVKYLEDQHKQARTTIATHLLTPRPDFTKYGAVADPSLNQEWTVHQPTQGERIAGASLLDNDGLLTSIVNPKTKTSLVPLYGKDGSVIYNEMGAGDRVPEGFTPRPPPQRDHEVAAIREEQAKAKEISTKAGQINRNLNKNITVLEGLQKKWDEMPTSDRQKPIGVQLAKDIALYKTNIANSRNTLAMLENGELGPKEVVFKETSPTPTGDNKTPSLRDKAIAQLRMDGKLVTEANISYVMKLLGK